MLNETDFELQQSSNCLRMAAQLFRCYGQPEVAKHLTEQADKNLTLIQPLRKA